MKCITIMQGSRYSLDSYGNGWGYVIADSAEQRSVWLQDEDAVMFRRQLVAYERRWPHKSPDAVLGTLWDTCDFDMLADDMTDAA